MTALSFLLGAALGWYVKRRRDRKLIARLRANNARLIMDTLFPDRHADQPDELTGVWMMYTPGRNPLRKKAEYHTLDSLTGPRIIEDPQA